MLQTRFKLKAFCSLIDQLNVHYSANFLDQAKANKYYKILEDQLIYDLDEKLPITIFGKKQYISRKHIAYGDDICYHDARSWNHNDIVSKVLRNIKHKVEVFTGLKFNYVLINRYHDGQSSIGAHRDKEDELGREATIAGVSLGSTRIIRFTPDNIIPQKLPKQIDLQLDHGSIYVMHHPTNLHWKHSIPKTAKVNKPRISLTFRYVYKDLL
jgi:alkylated DNA repair dioxygenase AlkB